MSRPLVVLVNGLPGAGKSTLARPLAEELGLPLLGKDLVKETVADVLGVRAPDGRPDRSWAAALGAASAETLWTLLSHAYSGAVVESNFCSAPELTAAGLRRAGIDAPSEVWCDVPAELARKRYRQRQPDRHPIHHGEQPDGAEFDDWWWRQDRPLGLGPLLRVDTTELDDAIIARVAAWCRAPSRREASRREASRRGPSRAGTGDVPQAAE